MLWEELNAKSFETALKHSEGVCILPIGVVEKHGNHLPLGTDMFTVRAVCEAAAILEPAVMFPYYFLGQIAEARHYPGTIAPSHKLMMDNLLAMCDEIARNGFKKILIMSGHGGNGHFLPFFVQEMPRLARNYCVYTGFVGNITSEQRKTITEAAGTEDLGSHAGVSEASMMMYLKPDLVHMGNQDPSEGKNLNRLPGINDSMLFTGFNWYADYPAHIAGDPTLAKKELGELIFGITVGNTVEAIKAVKADKMSEKFVKEFAEYSKHPKADVKHS